MPDRRRADVFFYGLFMDAELLRDRGADPQDPELGSVSGFELRIGERAALLPKPGGRVHGVVMRLLTADLERLYGEPSLEAYVPEAVLVDLDRGGVVAALCYNLPIPPAASGGDSEYAVKLRAIAAKVGLPPDYISRIGDAE